MQVHEQEVKRKSGILADHLAKVIRLPRTGRCSSGRYPEQKITPVDLNGAAEEIRCNEHSKKFQISNSSYERKRNISQRIGFVPFNFLKPLNWNISNQSGIAKVVMLQSHMLINYRGLISYGFRTL